MRRSVALDAGDCCHACGVLRTHRPSDSLGRRALRAPFYVGGLVATGAGLDTALRGIRSIAGERTGGSAAIESEVRFYGGIYFAYGLLMLSLAPRADRSATAVRGLAGALFVGGLARAGGWRATGRPHALQQALLAIELGAPPLLVAWQARLSER
jgi:hypothetical protein